MFMGRTVGFAEPGGPFHLDERLSACGPNGDDRSLARPVGPAEWLVTLWPANGDPPLERSGTASVVAGTTVQAKLDQESPR